MEGIPKQRNIPQKEELGPKRFEVQTDGFVKKRLDAIREGLKEMKEENPNVLGLTLFGSMVKGKAHEDSDVDGYLFLDVDRLAEEENELALQENREPRPVTFDIGDTGNLSTYPGEHLYDIYKPLIREKLTHDGSLSEEKIRDINIRPVGHDMIDKHLLSLQQAIESLKNGDSEVRIEPSQNLYGLFHLAVGHGLEGYRKYIIEELEQLGQEGEDIWRTIIRKTEQLEQYMYTDTPIHYPRTLTEARRAYISERSTE